MAQSTVQIIKQYQFYLEKLSHVRKAAADHMLDNTFSKQAHEAIAKVYEEDINKLTVKAFQCKEEIEKAIDKVNGVY